MAILAEHEKKRRLLGQHFLKDLDVIESITTETIKQANEFQVFKILEIGPGKGAITRPLIEKISTMNDAELVVAEKDYYFINQWKTSGLSILEGDFLDHSEQRLDLLGPIIVVSNLPYSAGTAILNRLLTRTSQISAMVLMFQAEVGQRLRSEPKSKNFGSLTAWTQNLWEVSKVLTVKPGAFRPPPKVNSEVILLRSRRIPLIPETQTALPVWQALIKVAFKQKRKMLRSNFQGTPFGNALIQSKIDNTLRAEQLSWDQWREIFLKCI